MRASSLTSGIGTLFAFVLVCGGVLILPYREKTHGRFHLPYINSKFIAPLLGLVTLALLVTLDPNHFHRALGRTGGAPNIPLLVFYALCVVLAWFSFKKSWSLHPTAGAGELLLPADRHGREQLAMVRDLAAGGAGVLLRVWLEP